jgi:hypothetical protein
MVLLIDQGYGNEHGNANTNQNYREIFMVQKIIQLKNNVPSNDLMNFYHYPGKNTSSTEYLEPI